MAKITAAGTATLALGTVTVQTTAAKAGMIVVLTTQTPAGTPGAGLSVGTITPGTSFVINSNQLGLLSIQTADSSTVGWVIVG
jgi:hypothetical protein